MALVVVSEVPPFTVSALSFQVEKKVLYKFNPLLIIMCITANACMSFHRPKRHTITVYDF